MPKLTDFAVFARDVMVELDRQQTLAQQQRQLEALVQEFAAFFALDRQVAMDQITRNVERFTAQQLRQYEIRFLIAGSYNPNPELVYRAMELYAWLKAEECRCKEYWVGFADEKE